MYVSTLVFPEPAPATTKDGPSQYVTAFNCDSFNADENIDKSINKVICLLQFRLERKSDFEKDDVQNS